MIPIWMGMGLINLIFLALHVTNKSSFPRPLSAQEEQEYLTRWEQGDPKAKEKLIIHNLRLVAHIAKKYYTCGKEQDDLISIGTIGLLKAINTFKGDKNIKLATYASRCIENEILMSLRWDKKTAGDVFFNDPIDIDGEGNPLTLLDIIADECDIPDKIDLKIKGERLQEYIEKMLTPREKHIIIQRYGLNGQEEKTQIDIAQVLGISRSYVSRIEKKALGKLRTAYENGKK